MFILPRRRVMVGAVALGAAGGRVVEVAQAAGVEVGPDDDPWPSLAGQIFGSQNLEAGAAVVGVNAPYRAEDAAIVPISIRDLGGGEEADQIRCLTLVIDQNPSPVAAKFILGVNSGIRTLSTRVRVDSYTNIHAVAQTADGRLHQAVRFVKAAGGCSAPVVKQTADAIPLGTMRFRQFSPEAGVRQLQLMVRHPNYSGMQMDQVSRLYVPAHYVSSVRIWQGDALLLAIEGGISISENPEFRFDYRPNGATEFRAEVADSRGQVFKQAWSGAKA